MFIYYLLYYQCHSQLYHIWFYQVHLSINRGQIKAKYPNAMYYMYNMKTKCLLCNNSFIQYLLFLFHKLSPLVLLLSCPLWYHRCIHILHGLDLSKSPEKQKEIHCLCCSGWQKNWCIKATVWMFCADKLSPTASLQS